MVFKLKTKIIATVGPSSLDYITLKNMALKGVNIFRINTKYGNINQYETIIKNIKEINKKNKLKCEILIDVKNIDLMKWLQKQDFDYLAIAFCDSCEKVKEYQKKLNRKDIKIIAKIETPKAIKNLKEIIKCSFGIMIARGDLGRNVPLQKLPIYQKQIIQECNKKKKFVITATEMLLSMQFNKIPERAEVSDVANAVLDGSNAVMLSEETTIGKYPVQTVEFMHKILLETEKWKNMK